MDTLPLPPRPDLAQYRKRAKELVAATKTRNPEAVRGWASDWLRALAKSLGVEITPFVQDSFDRVVEGIEQQVSQKAQSGDAFTLADAQFLIAQAHSFANWGDFTAHIEGPRDAKGRAFDAAADAVVGGDLETLRAMLRADPGLIRARSSRVHRVTLLHYVAANGVEDFRQRTPPNAVEIAKHLLDAGSEVDALAETYGGDKAQTTMNLLVSSTHPAEAGLQSKLVDVLLDYGAAINGLEDDGSPLMTALAFWYGDAAETLARRGARVDNVVAAASLGRLDLIKQMVADKQTLSPTVRFFETPWFETPRDPKAHIEMAFAGACQFQRWEVADFFLEIGVSPLAKDKDDMTVLHWAAATGNVELIERLVRLGAPLEAENRWGGTVLSSTAHFVVYGPIPGVDYRAAVKALIAEGADVSVLSEYATGNPIIDALR